MPIKVLYTFDDSQTPFLLRTQTQFPVKLAEIAGANGDPMTVGGVDLKLCAMEIVQGSPDNFKLDSCDYAVYYKDITEQPDEPFVGHGNLSQFLNGNEQRMVAGRVCQNMSANLFGDDREALWTLEIRLKLNTIEVYGGYDKKRQADSAPATSGKRSRIGSALGAVKATRTKSLPLFSATPLLLSVMNADQQSRELRFDQNLVKDRFKLAPFLQDMNRQARNNKSASTPTARAMRTRLVLTNYPLQSLPIHEELSDETDDLDYNGDYRANDYTNSFRTNDDNEDTFMLDHKFQALPDVEDLDSKRCHIVAGNTLPDNHGLCCINNNCRAEMLPSWRYIETGFHSNYHEIPRETDKFDKRLYEGMYGPLCNACYLFLRAKGFMRPELVVRKYKQQRKFKDERRKKEQKLDNEGDNILHSESHRNSCSKLALSPSKFATPLHTPLVINQAIQKQQNTVGRTPNNEFNDLMNQINAFGGPLTDIDLPLDAGITPMGVTPPMIAEKLNTRVINLDDVGIEEDDKENFPPASHHMELVEFEALLAKSIEDTKNGDPQTDWQALFGDNLTPLDGDDDKVTLMPSLPVLAKLSPPPEASRTDTDMSWVQHKSLTPNTEFCNDDEKS